MARGELCDSKFVCELMKDHMDKSSSDTFLVDGFPRSLENIQAWSEVIGDTHNVKFMCLFDVSGEEMRKRLTSRAAYD
jgi:adenylate kinase family enzyme